MVVRKLVKGGSGRLLSLVDLVLFSGNNLLLTLLISRVFGPEALAIFGIGLAIGLMSQSVGRGIYVVPGAVLSSRSARRRMSGLIAEHLICLYAVALFIISAFGLISLVEPEYSTASIVLTTLYCALLYMQADHDRFILLRFERHAVPPLLSAVNLIPLGLGLLAEYFLSAGFAVFMGLHVIVGLVRSIVVAWLVGGPNFRWGWRLLKTSIQKRGGFSLVSAGAYSGYNHIPLIILGHLAAPIDVAAFVAMRGLVQPTQMVFRLFDFRDKLSMRDQSGGTYEGLASQLWRVGLRNLLLSVFVGLACVLLGPSLSTLAYGSEYEGYSLLMVGHALLFMLMSFLLPIDSGVNILQWYNRNIYWRMAGGLVGACLAYPLAATFGAWGAVLACLIGWGVVVTGGIYVLRKVLFGTMRGRFPPSVT